MDKIIRRIDSRDNLPENEFIVRMTSESKDRHGTVIDAETLRTEQYRKNPVLLFQHNMTSIPVGKTLDFWQEDDARYAHVRVDGDTELEQLLIKKLNKKSLAAVSIGFDASDANAVREDGYTRIKNAELVELSIVSVGSNPDALVVERDVEKLIKGYTLEERKKDGEEFDRFLERMEKTLRELTDVLSDLKDAIDADYADYADEEKYKDKEKVDKKSTPEDDSTCTRINRVDSSTRSDFDTLYEELIDYKKDKRSERDGKRSISDLSIEDLEF